MLNILSRQQHNSALNIRYVIPFSWWQDLSAANLHLSDPNDLIIPSPLNFQTHLETLNSAEREKFIRMVGQKVSFLQIDNLVFNQKMKTATKWKTVSSEFFQILKRKVGHDLSLPLLYSENIKKSQNDPIQIFQKTEFKLIKLLICSFSQNHLFYGYIEKSLSVKKFIKQILGLFQYFYTTQTKVTFLETNEFRNFPFQNCDHELQTKSQLIMIHGLQRYDQKLYEEHAKIQNQTFFMANFQSPRINRIERNAEQLTMADQDSRTLSERTMSTGAQTPFTFEIEDQDWDSFRPYQNYALFGEKLQQEIQHMKQYAREAIYTDIIMVSEGEQELMLAELNKLAEDIEENIEKKKIYQKEIVKEVKQYYKQLKEAHHFFHIKEKDALQKESREMFQPKSIELEQKVRESQKPVVHFCAINEQN